MIATVSLCSFCITAGIRIESDDYELRGSSENQLATANIGTYASGVGRLFLTKETAALCHVDEHQENAIMFKCAGGSGSEKHLKTGKTTLVADIPKNADGLSKLPAAADFDSNAAGVPTAGERYVTRSAACLDAVSSLSDAAGVPTADGVYITQSAASVDAVFSFSHAAGVPTAGFAYVTESATSVDAAADAPTAGGMYVTRSAACIR